MRLNRMHPMEPDSPPSLAAVASTPRPVQCWLKTVLAVGLGLLVLPASAQTTDLEIGVRSKVTDGTPT